mgnify:FL=1|jgi:hypothetical protein
MRLTKSLLWAFAGLGMFACSSEDVVPEGGDMSGNGVVEVKIVAPNDFTRSLENATTGDNNSNVKVKGTLTIKLTATEGSDEEVVQLDGSGTPINVKFWGVKNPQKVEAYINDGEKVTGTTSIVNLSAPNMQAMPEAIPAYGETSVIKLSGKTEEGEDGKKYEMYNATVTMSIPVARLEISGITHVDHASGDNGGENACKYKELSINGIYLDKVLATKGATSVTDYCYPAPEDGSIAAPILWDAISTPNDFLVKGAEWPAADIPAKAYAYNFYPSAGEQPLVKIYFANATSIDSDNTLAQPRYAMIKTYNRDPDFKFEAGRIYRIKNVTLLDKNIIGDEEGNTTYGVDVTVEEAQWTVTDLDAEWVAE